jgi:hypothetical protein
VERTQTHLLPPKPPRQAPPPRRPQSVSTEQSGMWRPDTTNQKRCIRYGSLPRENQVRSPVGRVGRRGRQTVSAKRVLAVVIRVCRNRSSAIVTGGAGLSDSRSGSRGRRERRGGNGDKNDIGGSCGGGLDAGRARLRVGGVALCETQKVQDDKQERSREGRRTYSTSTSCSSTNSANPSGCYNRQRSSP